MWRLRFRSGQEPWTGAEVGDCWYYPNWAANEDVREHFLKYQASRQYLEQWAERRPPIVVRLPPGFGFSPDEKYRGLEWGDNPEREGWTVEGSIEDGTITVSPSINIVGTYHGSLARGVLSEDVEGRTYPGVPRTA